MGFLLVLLEALLWCDWQGAMLSIGVIGAGWAATDLVALLGSAQCGCERRCRLRHHLVVGTHQRRSQPDLRLRGHGLDQQRQALVKQVTFPARTDTGTVTGLTAGTTYTFTVAAVNGVGPGPGWAVTNAVTAS